MTQRVQPVIPLPAAGGVPVVIRCTMLTVEMRIQEDSSVNGGIPQGLIYWLLTPTQFGQYKIGPPVEIIPTAATSDFEPLLILGHTNDHNPTREPMGNGGSAPFPVCPGGPVTRGTVIVQMTSASATPTAVNVTEWN
jgi:hypothetical protein